ncbi:ABC transporter permease [Thalassotalea montiporae]
MQYLHYVRLSFVCAKLKLKAEVKDSYLSYIWWLLEPLMYMAVFLFVFGYLIQSEIENFPVYLLCGLIPWLWSEKSINHCVNSIHGNTEVLTKARVPILTFTIATLIQDFWKQGVTFSALLLLVALGSEGWSTYLPYLPFVIIVQFLLTCALGILVAFLVSIVRDLLYVVQTSLLLCMFASGIFYKYDAIPDEMQSIFFLNPFALIIKSYRDILMVDTQPDVVGLLIIGVCSLFFSVFLFLYLNKKQPWILKFIVDK